MEGTAAKAEIRTGLRESIFQKTGRICEFGSRTRLLRLMAMAAMVAMVAIEAETGPDQWHEGR